VGQPLSNVSWPLWALFAAAAAAVVVVANVVWFADEDQTAAPSAELRPPGGQRPFLIGGEGSEIQGQLLKEEQCALEINVRGKPQK